MYAFFFSRKHKRKSHICRSDVNRDVNGIPNLSADVTETKALLRSTSLLCSQEIKYFINKWTIRSYGMRIMDVYCGWKLKKRFHEILLFMVVDQYNHDIINSFCCRVVL